MPPTRWALPSPPVSADDASILERRFLAGLERGLAAARALPDPAGGPPLQRSRARIERTEYDRRVEREREALRLGRSGDRGAPEGRLVVERWHPRRLMGEAPALVVAAAVVHPERAFLAGRRSARPAGPDAIRPALEAALAGRPRFAWVAVLSSSGWDPSVLASPPTGRDHAVLPVRFDPPARGFQVLHPERDEMPWFETIRSLLTGGPPPPRADLPPHTAPPRVLRERLETARAAGESALEDLDREIEALEARRKSALSRADSAANPPAAESARAEAARAARRIEHCRESQAIHRKNLGVVDDMAARLDQIAALSYAGVDPDRVHTVVSLYEERLAEFLAAADAARALAGLSPLALLSPEGELRAVPAEPEADDRIHGEPECLS